VQEALSLLHAGLVALVVPLLLRLDLRRLQQWLEPAERLAPWPSSADGGEEEVVRAVGRRVERVIRWGRPFVRPGCLTRGVATYYLLRRAGVDVALCFGIGETRGQARTGHCWLVYRGEPVLEAADPRTFYAEVVRLSKWGVVSGSQAP
jgi:hypothetical protein